MLLCKSWFSNHTRADQAGFTLIELLVVIIILGILSAIALPSLLAQASKAKESEAKQYIGSTVRAQQAFYLENNAFTNSWEELELGIAGQSGNHANTEYYEYELILFNNRTNQAGVSGLSGVRITATPDDQAALKGYRSKVWLDLDPQGNAKLQAVTCEGEIDPNTDNVPNMNSRTYCP
ncbi:MAG: type IV pilin-like G/H family protein [Cyanobacteria bacterium P01_H01_bin.121]